MDPGIIRREVGLIFIPNFVGYSGDVVNEVQLAKNLCRETTCIIFGFVRDSKLFLLKRFITDLRREGWSRNVMIIPLPIMRPYTVSLVLASILLSPVVLLMDKLKHTRFIYVRPPILALGFMLIPSLARKTCVKIPAVFEDEERTLGRVFSFIYESADRSVLKRAGYICIPSPLLLREIALRRKTLPKGKIIWVPAGIDREKIGRIKKQVPRSINKDSYTIGFVGLLEWWQGVDMLVKAVAKIKDFLDKPVKLLIVGDGPEKRKIEALCKKLNVHCDITGFVKHEDALKLLKAFDILVVPRRRISSTEAVIPIKIIEAWALGVPVIATAHEIFKYMNLRDKEDIIFCEPDPEDIADKILLILKHKEIRSMLSKRGTQLAKKYYYDAIAMHIIKVVENNDSNH
uniref:Glycosyltransferase n=1 Tax=Ignisphaera aggregans TaxID=334771 RepID=A0A7J2U2A5_9CREN